MSIVYYRHNIFNTINCSNFIPRASKHDQVVPSDHFVDHFYTYYQKIIKVLLFHVLHHKYSSKTFIYRHIRPGLFDQAMNVRLSLESRI